MKKAFYVGIALVALTLGTAGCKPPKPVSGEVTKVLYSPKTDSSDESWTAAMRIKSGEIISLTIDRGTGDKGVRELAAKVTVGACIVVLGVSNTDSDVGDPSNVTVVSQHGPCTG